MTRTSHRIGVFITLALATFGAAAQAQFTAGNLVVTRFGDGASTPGNQQAASVFLEEYTTSGAFVQRIALPTADSGNSHAVSDSFNSTAEGALTLSQDGRFLTYAGYNAAPGTATVPASSAPRVVVRIDGNGVVDTSTLLTDSFTGGSPRSVASTNGSSFWVAGTGTNHGVRYTTAGSSSTQARGPERS